MPDLAAITVRSGTAARIETFALALFVRTLQGFATFAPICLVADMGRMENPEFVPIPMLVIAALLCGTAIGTALDAVTRARFGVRTAGCVTTAALSVGFALLWMAASPEEVVVSAVVLGLGVGTAWSSIAEIARQSLSTVIRWQGIRCWTVSFAVGLSMAVVGKDVIHIGLLAATILSVCSLLCLLFVKLPSQNSAQQLPGAVPRELPDTIPESVTSTASSEQSGQVKAEGECDATECCGGVQPVAPTGFAHGVLISTIGCLTLWGCLRVAAELTWQGHGFLLPTLLSAGIVCGFVLVCSASPSAGYVVILLPFLVLSIVTAIAGWLWSTGLWFPTTMFFSGFCYGGVLCGISAMTGELFSDCPSDAARTRVLTVSLFAASILLPAVSVMLSFTTATAGPMILSSFVFIGGILAIRAVPNPMISNTGCDEPLPADDDELEDIMAAINS